MQSIVKRVKAGPTLTYKMHHLKSLLINKFLDEDARGTIIKHSTLVRWVNELMIDLRIEGRFCSDSFVDRFKREFRITSRKITHIVQANKMKNKEELIKKSQEFVDRINEGTKLGAC